MGLVPGDGLASGLSVGEGVGVSSAAGVGVTLGDGLGEPFFFLLDLPDGDGELFGVGVTDASGVAVADGEAAGFGELVGFGAADDFGGALAEACGFGDGVGVLAVFFFEALELFRFFGAGVGSKMLLILSPSDCASARGAVKPQASAQTSNSVAKLLFKLRVPAGLPCSGECRHRSSRAGSSR